MKKTILFNLLPFFLVACGYSETPVDPTLTSIQENIFTSSCALSSCHNALSHKGNLVLTTGQSFAELINVLADNTAANGAGKFLVMPRDPDNSFLIQKLEGPGTGEGEQMPQRNKKLSMQKIQAIRQWITDGALDN